VRRSASLAAGGGGMDGDRPRAAPPPPRTTGPRTPTTVRILPSTSAGTGPGSAVRRRTAAAPSVAVTESAYIARSAAAPAEIPSARGTSTRSSRSSARDGFWDDDGCPELDDDRDGIADLCDRCPREAGAVERGGCPDPRGLVAQPAIAIHGRIFFRRGSHRIVPGSEPQGVLDAVADALRPHAEILHVRIVGHAEASERQPEALGLRRAAAVRDYLVAHGIDPIRLEIASRGATAPIAPPDPGVSQRVTFEIGTTRGVGRGGRGRGRSARGRRRQAWWRSRRPACGRRSQGARTW